MSIDTIALIAALFLSLSVAVHTICEAMKKQAGETRNALRGIEHRLIEIDQRDHRAELRREI